MKNLYYPDPKHINLEALRKVAVRSVEAGTAVTIHHHASSHPCDGQLHEHYDATTEVAR